MLIKKNKKDSNSLENKKKFGLMKYIYVTIGCFLTAFAFNVFFAPNNIVTGGVSGISIIVKIYLEYQHLHL